MSKVEVLCPNGHRVTVSVSQTTKIIKILEEACLKKGFLPICDYEIKHGKKTLEFSDSIQEAGLINLAKLELVKRSKPWVESKVLVQVQTSDGGRMRREFMPSTSLFEILERFEEDDGRGGHPKLLYHSNKAMRPVLNYVKDEIIGEYALRQMTLKSLGVLRGRIMFRHTYRQTTSEAMKEIEKDIMKEKSRFAKLLEKSLELRDKEEASTMCNRDASDVREEGPTSAAKTFHESPFKEEVSQVAQTFSSNSAVESVESSTNWMPSYAINPFANFKFPEETKGKNVYHNEFSDVNKEEFQACDRELKVYRLDEPMEIDVTKDDLPDTFYDITENDLIILQRDLEKTVKRLSDQPMMTHAMRQNEMEAKASKYRRVVIRVQFSDGTVIQGVFQPRETVHALYKFVKGLLKEESSMFELYTSPPKHVLRDKTQNLIEADLVPMSRLYFGSLAPTSECPVKADVLGRISSRTGAEEVVIKYISSSNLELKSEPERPQRMSSAQTGQKNPDAPKWLKLSKK